MSHGPRPDLTISIERPGSRRMRGLDRPGDRRGHGRHRERGEHPRPGPGDSSRVAAPSAMPPWPSWPSSRCTATRSCRSSPSAAAAAGTRAPDPSIPTLQQLEDEGLVTVEDRDGRRTFALTDAGRTAAAAIPAERPCRAAASAATTSRGLVRELGVAAMQVDPRRDARPPRPTARTILTEARRALYRLLRRRRQRPPPRPDPRGTGGRGGSRSHLVDTDASPDRYSQRRRSSRGCAGRPGTGRRSSTIRVTAKAIIAM